MHEVTAWKEEGLSLSLKTDGLSNRETFSREINEKYGEGGGLNANYRTVEAVAIVASLLGEMGLEYGKHFVFKTAGPELEISFDFVNSEIKSMAKTIFIHPFKIT